MKDREALDNIREKVQNANEALEHKTKEVCFGSLLVSKKKYDLICIKAAAFEVICKELDKKEGKNWWEKL